MEGYIVVQSMQEKISGEINNFAETFLCNQNL